MLVFASHRAMTSEEPTLKLISGQRPRESDGHFRESHIHAYAYGSIMG